MKRFLAVLLAAILAAWLWHSYKPPDSQPPDTHPTPGQNYVQRITCPVCNGNRFLLYAGGTRKDDCPLCINNSGVPLGYRDVAVREGYEICKNCGGMGLIIMDLRTHPPRTKTCPVCGGAGVLRVPK